MCKCGLSRGLIDENNDSVVIVAKLTSAEEFSDTEDLAKQYGGPTNRVNRVRDIQDYRLFVRFFAWVKKILPIFHFTMLAGLHLINESGLQLLVK